MPSTQEDELLVLLMSDIDQKLKVPALEYVVGLTSTEDGLAVLEKNEKFLHFLAASLVNCDYELLKKLVLKCLVNLTGSNSITTELVKEENHFVTNLLRLLTGQPDENSHIISMILSNITRQETVSEIMLSKLVHFGGLEKLVHLLCTGTPHSSYHYIALVLSNLMQVANGRRLLLDGKDPLLNRLLPFTTYTDSEVRRLGITGVIRNCCFDTEYHVLLLEENTNFLSSLLLPLAGPEELDEDEIDKLPLDLQYLEDSKERDPNPEIRKMILEALTQLCATKVGRKVMRDKNVYVILRELHKWEKVASVIVACENLVDILIGDEPQPGMENLKEIDIPSDLVEKFERMDAELLKINSNV